MKLRPALLLAVLTLASCDRNEDGVAALSRGCSTIASSNVDDCVRLNEVQVLGTHNSYHIAPPPVVLAWLGERGKDIDYSHRPLIARLLRSGC